MAPARLLVLAPALLYVLAFGRAMEFFIDEAYTFNLATDVSLARMLTALKAGADGSFPLHPILAFLWARLFGGSELSLRLTSGLFILLLVWQVSGQLSRRFSPWAAALALLVVLANRNFAFYASQARCYGLFVFLFSVVFWGAWRMIQRRQPPSFGLILGQGLACGALCLSHPLGILYLGLLALLYTGFSLYFRTFSVASAGSFLGGPLCLLAWLPAFLVQRKVNPTVASAASLPSFQELWQFTFLNSWPLCLILLAGGAFWLAQAWRAGPGAEGQTLAVGDQAPAGAGPASSRRALVLYAVLCLCLLNGALVLLETADFLPAYRFQAIRYLLVGVVPFAVILAAMFGLVLERSAAVSRPRWLRLAGPALLAALAVGQLADLATFGWRHYSARTLMEGFLVKVAQAAREKQIEVVCASHADAFYLVTQARYPRVNYILADDFPFVTLMRKIALYYPRPGILSPQAARELAQDYLFLPEKGPAVIVSPRKGSPPP